MFDFFHSVENSDFVRLTFIRHIGKRTYKNGIQLGCTHGKKASGLLGVSECDTCPRAPVGDIYRNEVHVDFNHEIT